MSAESPAARERIARWRVSFRHWRWQRPFWAGLLTLLAGVPIVYIPYADPSFDDLSFRLATTTGSGSLIIGILLVVLGFTFWFQRHARVFSGVAAILLGLVSLVVSNFGGFFAGFLLAVVGGAMGIAWVAGEDLPEDSGREPAGRRGGDDPAARTDPDRTDAGRTDADRTDAVRTDHAPAEKAAVGAEAAEPDGGTRAR